MKSAASTYKQGKNNMILGSVQSIEAAAIKEAALTEIHISGALDGWGLQSRWDSSTAAAVVDELRDRFLMVPGSAPGSWRLPARADEMEQRRAGVWAPNGAHAPVPMTLGALLDPDVSAAAPVGGVDLLRVLGGFALTRGDRDWWAVAAPRSVAAISEREAADLAVQLVRVAPFVDSTGEAVRALIEARGAADQGIDEGELGPRCVARGVDTLELMCSIKAHVYGDLEILKRVAQSGANPLIYTRGGMAFELAAHGSPGGFAFLLVGPAGSLLVSKSKIKITIRSHTLWGLGVDAAVELLLGVVRGWGQVDSVDVSRIDLCADFQGVAFDAYDLINRGFVTRSLKRAIHLRGEKIGDDDVRVRLQTNRVEDVERSACYWHGAKFTGLSFGSGGAASARLYDKTEEIKISNKNWFKGVWVASGHYKAGDPVFRVEFQIRSEALSSVYSQVTQGGRIRYGRAWSEVRARLGGLWSYLAGASGEGGAAKAGWLSLRDPNSKDKNMWRRALDPRWVEVQRVSWGRVWAVARIATRAATVADRAVQLGIEMTSDEARDFGAMMMNGRIDLGDVAAFIKGGVVRVGARASVDMDRAVDRAKALGAQARGVVAAYAAALADQSAGGWKDLDYTGGGLEALVYALRCALTAPDADHPILLCERAARRASVGRGMSIFQEVRT